MTQSEGSPCSTTLIVKASSGLPPNMRGHRSGPVQCIRRKWRTGQKKTLPLLLLLLLCRSASTWRVGPLRRCRRMRLACPGVGKCRCGPCWRRCHPSM
jgi:hypothetical protein